MKVETNSWTKDCVLVFKKHLDSPKKSFISSIPYIVKIQLFSLIDALYFVTKAIKKSVKLLLEGKPILEGKPSLQSKNIQRALVHLAQGGLAPFGFVYPKLLFIAAKQLNIVKDQARLAKRCALANSVALTVAVLFSSYVVSTTFLSTRSFVKITDRGVERLHSLLAGCLEIVDELLPEPSNDLFFETLLDRLL